MISSTGLELRHGLMDQGLRGCTIWEQRMDLEYTHGLTRASLKVTGKKIRLMERYEVSYMNY